ncbi:MAG TPA: tRNA preQ1(34) S-adenosylmethionine ribosyltransferase-isomerase QueA [Candidatus Limnocylindria bacterium]|nr:tRNA preQ1(34) S-adenosylmethionine ribosyltransferase-isomerase QueA [Candidatus Limnocylindria bacterium]
MKTSDFDYALPRRLIAQTPIEPRDASRMLVCTREGGPVLHRAFRDLPGFLRPGDALVLNRSKVIPARLLGVKADTGIPCEVLLLRRLDNERWEALVRPGRRLREGSIVRFGDGRLSCEVQGSTSFGGRVVRFSFEGVFEALLDELGRMPLPPYIHAQLRDKARYQTVYAREEGSAAAPTAGLHFTEQTLDTLRAMGVAVVTLLLHVGLGTFRPVKAEAVEDHEMHEEWYEVSEEAADALNRARAAGGRIVCVGTTAVRTLETVTDEAGRVHPGSGMTGIFITPGYRFKAADALLTNFHLPQSTLLMLVSAFMGRENALAAYGEAVRNEYRFFSFGDCMLILDRLPAE